MKSASHFNKISKGCLPELLGIKTLAVSKSELHTEMTVTPSHLAPNGYLHAGAVVTLADTSCGYGCLANLPEGASGFTTIELKSNHLATVLHGTIECKVKAIHQGRTTQVWDAEVTSRDTGKTLALFRCTQLVIYPK